MAVLASAAAAIAAACGLDAVGEKLPTTQEAPDARADVALPPRVDAEPPGDGGADAAADAPSSPCPPGLPGPTMVEIPDAGFCVDSTEVTNAQYSEFLAATADGGDAGFLDGGLPADCLPFVSFAPKPQSPGGQNEPVTYVSWCDAWAYCRWAGKHLCTGQSDAGAGEWRDVCTRGGTRALPYGDSPEAGACNVVSAAQAAVMSFPNCEGGYAGVFDMIGNVHEWIDECSAGSCTSVGGWAGNGAATSCATQQPFGQRSVSNGLGLRCCR